MRIFKKKIERKPIPDELIYDVDHFNNWFNHKQNGATYAHSGIFLRTDKLSKGHILEYLTILFGPDKVPEDKIIKFHEEIRKDWMGKLSKKTEYCNSTFRLYFSKISECRPDETYIDTKTGEIFRVSEQETSNPEDLLILIEPRDIIAQTEYDAAGLDIFSHDEYSDEHPDSCIIPLAKLAKDIFDKNDRIFETEFELGFKMTGGSSCIPGEPTDYWSEYEFIGVIKHKEYELEPLESFVKSYFKNEAVQLITSRGKS